MSYQPKTGEKCHCKPGVHRDNCPDCEGAGMRIDFKAIRNRSNNSKAVAFDEKLRDWQDIAQGYKEGASQ